MKPPEVVLLDGQQRHLRAAVLKARGFTVFSTEYVVEVCLRWNPADCAVLIIGPEIPWQQVATLCDWIKINSPEKPIFLLSNRQSARCPATVDAVIPTQPVNPLVERLRALLPAVEQDREKALRIVAKGDSLSKK
jgi:hypothetical protein